LFNLPASSFETVTRPNDCRHKNRALTTKILSSVVAVGALLCAAADAQNAGSSAYATAPGWMTGALYNPSSKTGTYLPAESGVNLTLAPFAGYVNVGSGNSGREFSGSSGSVAFPVGQSFGLLTNFTAASLGSNGLYDVGSNFYWRAPSTGLIGAIGEYGEFTGTNGFKYGMGGANAEGYFGRVTLYAVGGAFNLQGLGTYGLGTVGAAYYPIDNLELSLSGYDDGGITGGRVGFEYLLPKAAESTVAVTVGADGYIGNHGSSGATARLRFLTGLDGPNNKTLIERRREDDPTSYQAYNNPNDTNFFRKDAYEEQWRKDNPPQVGVCIPNGNACTTNSSCCSGFCYGTCS
jgi:hypothetical protein